jgi:hypothetical protein
VSRWRRAAAARSCWTTREERRAASFARVHRQLMGGRDAVAAFSGNLTTASKTTYDANGDRILSLRW